MTRLFLIISVIITLNTQDLAASNFQTNAKNPKTDTLLLNIERKIYGAFIQSFKDKNNSALLSLDKNLEEFYKSNSQKLAIYWRGYLHYYSAIYYLKNDDKKASEETIDKGVDLIESIKDKNSEDFALLALLQGFAIQFKGMKAMFLSAEIKENAQIAISKDSNNLRGYYACGSNDFYTPEKFGGGKEAEKYLLKAVSIESAKVKNPYLPKWGQEEAYSMLIRLYIREAKTDEAKKYYKEAAKKYPNSYSIKSLANKLN